MVFVLLFAAGCQGAGHGGFLPSSAGHRTKHALSTTDSYAAVILADGPTAYYRLDDTGTTAADSSGNALNGTVGASVTEGAASLLTSSSDAAMILPGSGGAAGLVKVPQTTLLQPTAAVSLEAWLQFGTTPANYAVAVCYGNDNNYAPYDLYFVGGKIRAQFELTTGVLEVTSPSALQKNTAYHVVSTYDGTTGRLYVNGALVASVAKTGTLTEYLPGYGFAIGDDAALSDPPFSGVVDEVAVYAGKALSAAQVLAHYSAGSSSAPSPTPSPSPTPTPAPSPSPTPPPTPTPVPTTQPFTYAATIIADGPTAYYHLDDVGMTAADSSGNGLNGAIGSSIARGVPGLLLTSSDAAMSFPGSGGTAGIVKVPQALPLQPSNAVSLEAWLRFSSMPANYAVPVGYGNDNHYAPYDLYFVGGKIVAQFELTTGTLTVASPSVLLANTAYHVVSTFDGTTGRLYVNGIMVASAAKSGTLTEYLPGYGLAIGDDAAVSDPLFNGTVDEVAVYAGKALSAQQVVTHYEAGTGTVPIPIIIQ